MDIASLISSFANGTYTVTRTARGSTKRGRIEPGGASTVTITAAWHPAGGEILQRLPEGRNSDNTRVLYTTTRLYIGGPGSDYEADQISISGITWEVEKIDTWQDGSSGRTGYVCTLRAV